MTPQDIDRIQCAIRHIKTSVDIDPWAMEIAVEAMEKQMEDLKNSPTQMSGTSDLIRRQDAIDAINNHLRRTDVPASYPGIVSALTEWLNELPSVQPDSKESSSTHKALDNNLPSAQPDWKEMLVICDNCGHAIAVKRGVKDDN